MSILTVAANGWQAQYNGTPPTFTPDTAPENITVSRAGFDTTGNPTTYTDTLVINRRVRDRYPNQANDVTTATSFSPDNAVALSDYVYSTDSISGVTNNSTEISPQPYGHWLTPDRLLVGNTIGRGTGFDVEVFGSHRNGRNGRMLACVVFSISDGTNTITVPVSQTIVSGRGGDKLPVVVYALPSTDISTLTALTGSNNIITVNCKMYPWIGSTATTPSAVLDSATSGQSVVGFSPRYFLRDVTRASAPPIAYVSATGTDPVSGSGGGKWSTNPATAAANPFLTATGAFGATANSDQTAATGGYVDGCRIRIGDASTQTNACFILSGPAVARTQRLAAIIVERDPAVSRSIAKVGFTNFRPKLSTGLVAQASTEGVIMFSDVSVLRTASSISFTGESANNLRVVWNDVDFDNGNTNVTQTSFSVFYMYGFTATRDAISAILPINTRIVRGAQLDVNGGGWAQFITCGSVLTRVTSAAAVNGGVGVLTYCNKFVNPSSTSPITYAGTSTPHTISDPYHFGQNVVEIAHTNQSTPWAKLSADIPAHGDTVNLLLWNNTVTGWQSAGRNNAFYDWTLNITAGISGTTLTVASFNSSGVISVGAEVNGPGVTAGTVIVSGSGSSWQVNNSQTVASGTLINIGENRIHRLAMDRGNIWTQVNLKGDVWSQNPASTGNMPLVHGVGAQGSISQYRSNSGIFSQEQPIYFGRKSSLNNSSSTTPQFDPTTVWTAYAGTTTAGTVGAGGGDYTPIAGSPLIGTVIDSVMSHDLAGRARQTTFSAAGAFEPIPTYNATGGMTFGGTATLSQTIGLSPTGAMTFGGSAALGSGIVLSASGGSTFSGAVTLAVAKVLNPSGGMTFSGAVSVTQQHPLTATDIMSFGGGVTLTIISIPTPNGAQPRRYVSTLLAPGVTP